MPTQIPTRMNVQKILNTPQKQEIEIPDSRTELAAQAQKELKYNGLMCQIEKELKAAAIPTKQKVLQILSEIGPDTIPFEPESVKKYQNEKTRKDMPFLYRHGIHGISKDWSMSFFLATAVSLIATIISVGIQLYQRDWWPALLLAGTGLLTTFVIFVIFAAFAESEEYGRIAYWERKPISEYWEPVPEFALETALAIKEKVPQAEFFIESFMTGKKRYDPFLLMTIDGENYYFEVWNEPNFEAKRLA